MADSRRRDGARPPAPRSTPDACPGAWRRHDAADGALARFRLVGGALTGPELQILAGAALGGGSPLELTSRGSVQVRGLSSSSADDLADALRGLGAGAGPGGSEVLDTLGRDLPCGLIASPRSGRSTAAHADVDPWARAVAAGLRGRTEVPGRFLIALDDGRGDVLTQHGDVALVAGPAGVALHLDATDSGLRVAPADAPALALAAVAAFTELRDGQWRVAELPDGVAGVAEATRARLTADGVVVTAAGPTAVAGDPDPAAVAGAPDPAAPAAGDPDPATPVTRDPDPDPARAPLGVDADGVLEVLPPLGEIDVRATAALLRALGPGVASLRVTPWRTLVLRDLPDPVATAADLAAAGLETDPASPWTGLSACVGAPRCAKSHTDVRGDLTRAVEAGRAGRGQVAAHWVGCGRACGTPGGRVAVVEATGPDGYRTVVRRGRVSA